MAKKKEIPELIVVAKGVGAYPATWDRWDAAAKANKQKRQEWIRDTLNAAASIVEKRTTAKKGGK